MSTPRSKPPAGPAGHKPRLTMEVDTSWLETELGARKATPAPTAKASRVAPPPLPPPGASAAPAAAPAEPPPLVDSAARHNTMPVEAQWLEVSDIDAKLRASLPPLPPPDAKVRARMSRAIPREDPDEPATPVPSAAEPAPMKRRSKPPATKIGKTAVVKKTASSAAKTPRTKR